MSIAYSDGVTIENRILGLLQNETDLRASSSVASEHYGDWAVEYHLCPERSNLFRHMDLSGLDILELGAGMGGVSRYLAESARSLTVVEGTEARFAALSVRLRDLKNWKGSVSNIQDFHTDQRFDAVCVIGVLEYSELYLNPPPGSVDGPFGQFLRHAASFLKKDGVLILAIENKLGLKYWSGAAEDHTGAMFDSIAGYPPQPTPRTFSRQELLGMLKRSGFERTEEFYPFPDYKIPNTVLARTLVERAPELAADMAKNATFQNYGTPRFYVFPELLAMHSISQAGLLPEFSNSFLFVASPDPLSQTLQKILRTNLAEGELGWHYSLRRKNPSVTKFSAPSLEAPIETKKRSLSLESKSADISQAKAKKFQWHQPEDTPIARGAMVRTQLVRRLYFKDWSGFQTDLESFLRWSFNKWKVASELSGLALDAIYHNAIVLGPAEYQLFDLEWTAIEPVKPSWFILRNVFGLIREIESFSTETPFRSFGELYKTLCEKLGVTPDLDADIQREAEFQETVSTVENIETHLQDLRNVFNLPLNQPPFPRNALQEYQRHNRLTQLIAETQSLHHQLGASQQANAHLQLTMGQVRDSVTHQQEIVAHLRDQLNSPPHIIARYIAKIGGKIPGLSQVGSALFSAVFALKKKITRSS
ncbi:methyltransferase domain-containing protein [Bdellovibrionota bacterium FG-2]